MDDVEQRINSAFAAVRREAFLPTDQRGHAGEDRPLPIGHGQTNSQPTTVRNMLRLLDPRPGQHVLDVGSGSGWAAALLGVLVGPTGQVYGVELVPELVELGQGNLAAFPLSWVRIQPADADTLGLPACAPYDRILVSAGARRLPRVLIHQLARPGRMVIPVRDRLNVVERDNRGRTHLRKVGHYAFVPLKERR